MVCLAVKRKKGTDVEERERERGGDGGEREEISVGKIDRSRSLESELEFVIGGRGLRSEAGGTGDGETDATV